MKMLSYCEADNAKFYIGLKARGEDFETMLNHLRTSVPVSERTFNREQKYWEIDANPTNEATLRRLFPEFGERLDTIRAQLHLF